MITIIKFQLTYHLFSKEYNNIFINYEFYYLINKFHIIIETQVATQLLISQLLLFYHDWLQ